MFAYNENRRFSKLSLYIKLAAIVVIGAAASRADSTRAAAASVAPASTAATAQAPEGSPAGDPFALGEKVVFGGLSLEGSGVYGNTVIPPLVGGFDFAFHKYMTLGGLVGYSRNDYGSGYSDYSISYITVLARGTFHPLMWLSKLKIPLDPYGVASIGYNKAIPSWTTSASYSNLILGPSVGARYWFTPGIAVWAESGIGAGLGLLSTGIAFKL